MVIKFRNSLTREKEDFVPLNQEKIGLYVCGPTVYDAPHIGNGRSIIIYDILYRLLCQIYGQEKVTYVRNITDVDDKINDEAKKRNISINQLTAEITKIFHDNAKSLNCLPPTIEPRATEHLQEMIELIEILLEKNIAYIGKDQSVYFDVSKYAEYGNLAGRKIEDLRSGTRLDFDEAKQNQEDFVLWKKSKEGDDSSSIFPSPWCDGKPGWHIECSAMSVKYLGINFDIHGGGADLIFPHHTNEIAQTCGAYPESKFAKYWVHNGFVTVNGEKMSKSLGNFITIRQLLEKEIKGEYIRYALISSLYRKPLDWSEKLLSDAKKNLDKIYKLINCPEYQNILASLDEEFIKIISDDLNTPNSLAYINELVNELSLRESGEDKKEIFGKLKFIGKILGLWQGDPKTWFEDQIKQDLSQELQAKIELRNQARAEKNWHLADKLRKELEESGVIIEDNPSSDLRKS